MTKPAPEAPALVQQRTQEYIRVRDKLKEMDERHEKERAPLLEVQNLLSGWIMHFLEQSGVESVRTKHGTCSTSTRYTASLADPDAFMNFVKSKGLFDLLDRRASATAVRAYVEEHKNLPPGVNLSALRTVSVRRPTKTE